MMETPNEKDTRSADSPPILHPHWVSAADKRVQRRHRRRRQDAQSTWDMKLGDERTDHVQNLISISSPPGRVIKSSISVTFSSSSMQIRIQEDSREGHPREDGERN